MENKNKILETIDNFMPDISGAIRAVNNYAKYMSNNNIVTVATMGAKEDIFDYVPYNVEYSGSKKSYKQLFNRLSKQDFDIIHVHSYDKIFDMSLKLAKKKNIPIVATIHSNFLAKIKIKYGDGFKSKILIKKIIKKYNKCNEVFVTSPYVLQLLRQNGFVGKVSYMPLASDLNPTDRKEELIKKANKTFDIDIKDKVLISIGNIRKTKRLDFALQALVYLKKQNVNFKYFVVGKGEELDNLKELTKKLKLTKNVKFLGFIPDEKLCQLIARADLLLLPTTYDFFGLAKVECAGFGTCGVYIRDSFVSNEVFDKVNGYTSLNKVEEYAKTILNAISDNSKLKEVSSNAYNDLYMTWDKSTEILQSRLIEIANEKVVRPKRLRFD